MEYMVIAILIAAAGAWRLWVVQRKVRSNFATIEGFQSSLQRITSQPAAHPGGGRHGVAGEEPRVSRKASTLDPARRAAAKQRLEARRRTMQAR